MKCRIIVLAALAVIIYSCAAKSSAPTATATTEVKPPPAEVKPPPPTEVKNTTTVATVMTPELAEGKSLFENNCAKCHQLYDPKKFSAEDWKPIVARMQNKAHLDDLSGQKIYNYVSMK